MAGSSRLRAAVVPVRASIVDVARLAGVSVATVSRALRGLPNVSATTRERVLSAAGELEYTASPLAAALVTGRTHSVGVIATERDRQFFTAAVRGIDDALRERGYDLVVYLVPEDVPRREQFFAGPPMRRRVDALVLAGLRLTGAELAALRQLQLPLAGVGAALDGVHTERIDDEAAARFAVQHLIDLGHTRIALIGSAPDKLDSEDDDTESRSAAHTRGFQAALAAAGLKTVALLPGGRNAADGSAAMTELLAGAGRPTAVFCQSDELAFGALVTLWRAGVRCPESISVLGFGDHELASGFGLTTIAQPTSEQGAAAVQWLAAGLDRYRPAADADQPPTAGSDVLHPVRLVLRGTTAAVSSAR